MEISMTYHASEERQSQMNAVIAQAQSGDREAFGVIFNEYYRFIYKFVYAMSGDCHLAEELTQETFLKAYNGIGSLRSEASLKYWLCAIAKNVVFMAHRTERKEGKNCGEELETLTLFDDKNRPPDECVLDKELNRRIASALAKLNADKRLIFILKEMQQLSYKEISEITGSAIPKLKTDLFRAKTEMRAILRPYIEGNYEL